MNIRSGNLRQRSSAVAINRMPRQSARTSWPSALWAHVLLGLLIAGVGFRALEFVPYIAIFKPLLLLTTISLFVFLYATQGQLMTRPLRNPIGRWVVAFFVWMFACVPTSLWRGASIGIVKGMVLTGIAVWILLAFPRSPAVAERIQRIFVLCAVSFALLVTGFGGESVAGRFGADIGLDVNDIALVAAVSVPLTIGVALRASAGTKLLYWVGVALLVVTVMRTGSRGGGLALLMSIPVLLSGLPLRRTFQLVVLGVPLAIASWATAPESFRERMSSLFAGEQDYNQTDADGRIAIWKRGLSYGIESPILGVGPGAFFVQDGIGKAARGLTGKWSVAHNIFVQVFAEMGLPGLLILLGVITQTGVLALRAHRGVPGRAMTRRPELLAALIAFITGAFFLSFLFYGMTWLLLAALASMSHGVVSPGQSAKAEVRADVPRVRERRRRPDVTFA